MGSTTERRASEPQSQLQRLRHSITTLPNVSEILAEAHNLNFYSISNTHVVRALCVCIFVFVTVATWVYFARGSDNDGVENLRGVNGFKRFEPTPFSWWGNKNNEEIFVGGHRIAHPWMAKSVEHFEHLPFEWDRRCEDISPLTYVQDLQARVETAFDESTTPAPKLSLVLTSSAHAAPGGSKTGSTGTTPPGLSHFLPPPDHLPSLLYRCTVEAALMVNPSHSVRLFARTSNITEFVEREIELNPSFETLLGLKNFQLIPIEDDESFIQSFAMDTSITTPMDWLFSRSWTKDDHLAAHVSDLFRLLIVQKDGGVYMDMDSLSVQDLRRYAPNVTWVVSDGDGVPRGLKTGFVVNGIFSDVQNGGLTKKALELLDERYQNAFRQNDPSIRWGAIGPRLMTEAAQAFAAAGGEIDVMKTWDFLPLHWSMVRKGFFDIDVDQLDADLKFAVSHANTLHVFGMMQDKVAEVKKTRESPGSPVPHGAEAGDGHHEHAGSNAEGDHEDSTPMPHPDSVVARTMINRCPLVYCQELAKRRARASR